MSDKFDRIIEVVFALFIVLIFATKIFPQLLETVDYPLSTWTVIGTTILVVIALILALLGEFVND